MKLNIQAAERIENDGSLPDFRAALRDAAAMGAQIVSIDLTATTYVDFPGLMAIVGAHARLAGEGVELVLENASDDIWDLIEMTRVSSMMLVRRIRVVDPDDEVGDSDEDQDSLMEDDEDEPKEPWRR